MVHAAAMLYPLVWSSHARLGYAIEEYVRVIVSLTIPLAGSRHASHVAEMRYHESGDLRCDALGWDKTRETRILFITNICSEFSHMEYSQKMNL